MCVYPQESEECRKGKLVYRMPLGRVLYDEKGKLVEEIPLA